MGSLRLIGALAVLLAVQPAASALSAAERVTVRAGEHPGFSRLVFDWARPAKARLEQAPGQARLTFDRAGELDTARVLRDLPPGVTGLAAEGVRDRLTVVVAIAPDAKLRLLEVDSSTVLDVMRPETPLDAPPARRPGEPEETLAAGAPPISLLAPPARVDESPQTVQDAAPQSEATNEAAPVETRPLPPPRRKPARPSASASAPDAKTPNAKIPNAAGPNAGALSTETPVAASEKTGNRVLVLSDRRPTLIDDTSVVVRRAAMQPANNLRFQWQKDVALAVFRRGPHLWLVFDQASPGDVARALRDLAPDLVAIEQLQVPDATVLRLTAPPILAPKIVRDGATWVVELWPYGPRPARAVEVEFGADGKPADVFFRAKTPGRAISLVDPDSGMGMVVVPAHTEGQGLGVQQTFPQFQALESFQGVAFEVAGDGVTVAVEGEGIRVSHGAGLVLSRGGTLALSPEVKRKPALGPRLFDLEAWRGANNREFAAVRQAAQKQVVAAPSERRAMARLDLARLYFAHGFAAEAAGELRLTRDAEPPVDMDPEIRLIRGASSFLAGDYATAAADIFHPTLAGEAEAELWNAAMAAAGLDWDVAANKFAKTADLIPAYPHGVRTRLWLLAAEAYLGTGDTERAGAFLELARGDRPSLDEQAQIAVLVARRLQMDGDVAAARSLWQRVADVTSHRASKIRARLALLDLAIQERTITVDQAIEELERLRFAWRGDQVELAMLRRLAELYLAQGESRRALRALRQATAAFPETRLAQDVAQRMRDVFYELFVGPAGETMAPLNALALYEEFKELTPPGAKGDRLILRLVDRLVEVDLLPRAADLLSTQVKFRLSGVDKAEAGGRLAHIYLLDGKPEEAMAALAMSEESDLPDGVKRKRTYVRARALADQYRYDDALKLLAADEAPQALRLRADLLWEQANWPAVVVALSRLVPEAAPSDRPLSADESRNVADLAVALTLAGERDKLVALNRAYGVAMNGAPDRETFALLAAGLAPGATKSIAQELAEVERAEEFIASYRDRLQQASGKRVE